MKQQKTRILEQSIDDVTSKIDTVQGIHSYTTFF